MSTMSSFTKTILFTDSDGRARFRDESLALTEGKPAAMLSPLMPSGGYQLRRSPVGFRSEFHCTGDPQWVFILGGQMEIGLQDGSSRIFGPGDHFFSADTLPAALDHFMARRFERVRTVVETSVALSRMPESWRMRVGT